MFFDHQAVSSAEPRVESIELKILINILSSAKAFSKFRIFSHKLWYTSKTSYNFHATLWHTNSKVCPTKRCRKIFTLLYRPCQHCVSKRKNGGQKFTFLEFRFSWYQIFARVPRVRIILIQFPAPWARVDPLDVLHKKLLDGRSNSDGRKILVRSNTHSQHVITLESTYTPHCLC